MNAPKRMHNGVAQPSVADYLNAVERARAREGMHQAMNMGNATLRAVARFRAAVGAVTSGSSAVRAPTRVLAKTGVTYTD